jgi:hypothetical protein
MLRPGRSRPYTYAGRIATPLPVTPDMLNALTQAIAGGVTDVWYGDRRVSFMSLDDLLRAWEWVAGQLGLVEAAHPTRRGACFSKGLTGGSWLPGGVEHQEVADTLWSRGAQPAPTMTEDVDWERATGPRRG